MALVPVLLALLQAPQEPSPKPTLPAVRRATIALDKVPADEAIRRFRAACGFPVRRGGGLGHSAHVEDARPISLTLDRVPMVEAVSRYAKAEGYDWFEWRDEGISIPPIVMPARGPRATCFGELFAFRIVDIEETVVTDFAEETRRCDLDLVAWWQPDVCVFRICSVELEEAVDDLGTDLRRPQVAPPRSRDEPTQRTLSLALPPRRAKSVARLKGTIEFEVPGDVVEVQVKDLDREDIALRVGDFDVRGRRSGSGDERWWEFTASGATVEALAEARAVRKDTMFANDRAGERIYRKGETPIAWFEDDKTAKIESLSFKIVRNRARVRVRFEFADIDLARPK